MNCGAIATKLSLLVLTGVSLSACLGPTRPDTAFPSSLNVAPRGAAPVVIAGRVEAVRPFIATLNRSVVLTANGTDIGRAELPDARLASAAQTPVAINGSYQGTSIAANCENHAVAEPVGERGGIFHTLTFAAINCQVNYGGRPAGTLAMTHNPRGSVVAAASVTTVAVVR